MEGRQLELKRLSEELKNKAIYYQKIAEEGGKAHLRRIEQLSKLIFKHKHTMEALTRSEKLLSDTFEAIPDLLTVQDRNQRVLTSNWQGCDHITPEERLGPLYCYQVNMNRDTPCEPCHAKEVFETGKRKRIEKTDPQSGITREINIYPVLDETFNVAAIIVNIRDISELRQAEKQKKCLEEQLLQAQKMEALGTLAGGVAHDLNNVLVGIIGYPELLLIGMDKNDPLRKPIEAIKQSGLKAAAIVNDLLVLARRGVIVTEVMNLNNIIYEYLVSPEYEKLKSFHPHVEVKTSLDKNLLNTICAPFHLSNVVMNLVSNAAEAMPNGGELYISTEDKSINEPVKNHEEIKNGDYVVLTVTDTGSGISPKDINRIFEPFYTKKVMGRSGTGLGMAIVWGIVKDHNGYIVIESVENKGTTVMIYLPATTKKIIPKNHLFTCKDHLGEGESILVVDDVEDQRKLLYAILSALGYSVKTLSSGEEAIAYLKNHTADLVLLDMVMDPNIDGLDTYKRILEIDPKQKAIIISGYSETDRVKEAIKLGASAYIKKPYQIDQLGLALKHGLNN